VKKIIKKYFRVPSIEELKQNRHLKSIFGALLNRGYLWHFHRHNVTRAAAIGLFCCCLPMPFQMIPATALALWRRAHLPISIALVWVSNPVTMPFMLIFQYKIGAFLLNRPYTIEKFSVSWHWFTGQFLQVWQPLLLGAFLMGVLLSAAAFFTTKYVWRFWIIRRWQRDRGRVKMRPLNKK